LHLEASEAADLDAFAPAQGVRHRIEDRVHDDLGVLLRDVRRALRDLLDETALRHRLPPEHQVHNRASYSSFLRPSFSASRSPSVERWLFACCAACSASACRVCWSWIALIDKEIFCSFGSTRVTIALTRSPSFTTSDGFATGSAASSPV